MKIYNIIILDASGSMSDVQKPSVDGVNETIQTIRSAAEKDAGHPQILSLYSFSSIYPENIHPIVKFTSIGEVSELPYDAYCPCGGTPLYDAVGEIVTLHRQLMEPEDKALVTIITDGYENSSTRYHREDIRKMISELKEKGWIFTYIGANQDALQESSTIGIENAMNFCADEEGTREMWKREIQCRTRFYSMVRDMDEDADTQKNLDKMQSEYFKEKDKS